MHKRIKIPINNKFEILYISETEIDNSFQAVQHSHPNLEIIIVVDGKGNVVTKDRKYQVKKNDILFINPFVEHFEKSSSILKFYAIGLNNLKTLIDKDFNEGIIHYFLENDEANKIINLSNLLFIEANNKNKNYLEIITLLFKSIQIIFERNFYINLKKDKSLNETSLISSCKHLIENYYYEQINIQNLAKRFSVSVSYLCHKFKEETGFTLIEYKIKNQLEEAKNLLLISDMSILEISDSVGFSSSSYFNKLFKKSLGITPKEYRKTNKKN